MTRAIWTICSGNVRYATGWHFSVNERPVGLWLPVEGAALLLVPFLELENALSAPGVEVRTYEEFPGERPAELWMVDEAVLRRFALQYEVGARWVLCTHCAATGAAIGRPEWSLLRPILPRRQY